MKYDVTGVKVYLQHYHIYTVTLVSMQQNISKTIIIKKTSHYNNVFKYS